ncbi:MAG: SsrA-binding protein SmpB [Salibacteraceae bacterium]
MSKARFTNDIKIKNRKARFEFNLIDKYVAGIELLGTEIKSIREGKANINDAFVSFLGNQMYVRNMHIDEYELGTHYNHEPKRDRKLLLNKQEIAKIHKHLTTKGYTAVPTLLFINGKGLAKLEFATAQGKKLHDKREDLKQKDIERDIRRGEAF